MLIQTYVSEIFFRLLFRQNEMCLKQYVFNTIGCNNPNVHFLFSLATPQKKSLLTLLQTKISLTFFQMSDGRVQRIGIGNLRFRTP